jgi:dienelactone hydrolase
MKSRFFIVFALMLASCDSSSNSRQKDKDLDAADDDASESPFGDGNPTGDDDNDSGSAADDDLTAPDDDSTSPPDDDVVDDDTTYADDDSTIIDDDSTASDDDATPVNDDSTFVDDDSTFIDDDSTADDDTTVDDDTSAPDDDSTLLDDDSTSPPEPLFDLPMIRDAATAQCDFSNQHTVLNNGLQALDVWNVSFYSWESINGQLQPILIKGYAAKPADQDVGLPGIVLAHGLGGMSDESATYGLAGSLSMFVISYTGPGGGDKPENTSEGLPSSYDNGKRMFDTIPDVRGSWFWGHAVAALRAVTCLETRPEVEKSKLGITGFSAGGVISLMTAGVDDRIKASVPISGTGAMGVAVESPNAWQHGLLTLAGYTTASIEWTTLLEVIGADVLVQNSMAKIMMINGSCDEFFPLTAHLATFDKIPGDDKRTSLIGNYDHGCYSTINPLVDPAADIEKRAGLRASGGQKFWFNHWFAMNGDYSYSPLPPTVQLTPQGATTLVLAAVDETDYDISEVRLWVSNDDAFIFYSDKLDKQGAGLYGKISPFALQPNTVYFVDVQYQTKNLLFPQEFSISSPPVIPQGLIPHIRTLEPACGP